MRKIVKVVKFDLVKYSMRVIFRVNNYGF
jgi:hypothetical protein